MTDLTERYIELRKTAARGTDSLAADIMRHLHTRQHLGKAVVVCAQPLAMLAASRKQWLKLSRSIQKQRASTLNADKILKFTHTITHMQHMRFTSKSPLHTPEADVYFLPPHLLEVLPAHCWTVYVTEDPDVTGARSALLQLPLNALIVDYIHTLPWENKFGLRPKKQLEAHVSAEWRQAQQFLKSYDIDIDRLMSDDIHDIEAMDDALDTLLGVSHAFLQVADGFQRALELARPLRVPKGARTQYDTFVLLAHRVQALSPGAFTQHFLETYNEDDTFFLHDIARAYTNATELAALYARHYGAGRVRLARALVAHASSVNAPRFPRAGKGKSVPPLAAPHPQAGR